MAISIKLNPKIESKINSEAKTLNISTEIYLQNKIEDLLEVKLATSDNKQQKSLKILQILNNFIIYKYDNLKYKKASQKSLNLLKIIFENRWLLLSFSFLGLSVLSLLIIAVSYPNSRSAFLFVILMLSLSILCCVYVSIERISTSYKSYKEVKRKAIDRVLIYDPEAYQQVVYELGESFYEEELYKEEIRFEIAIREREKRSNVLKKATPLIVIFIVATAIYIFGMPESSTQINLLYGTVAGVSGIVFVTKVVFDIYSELLDEDLKIYETCISILQKARAIAKEEELDAIKAYDMAVNSDDETIPFEVGVSDTKDNHS